MNPEMAGVAFRAVYKRMDNSHFINADIGFMNGDIPDVDDGLPTMKI